MARRNPADARPLAGIVLVDKPPGMTSNRALQMTKRMFRARKAGHTGTLDPMATGMLPICFGAATRVSGLMLESSKRYDVTANFGLATDTGDASGEVIETRSGPAPAIDALRSAVASMTGSIRQVPPMYSALKQEGKRLYELARQGREVPRPARAVEIHELTIRSFDWPYLSLSVHCSKGTYIRTLVTDLAAGLGSVAHVTELRRLAVGPYEESQMVTLETLEAAATEGLDSLDRWLLGIDTALIDRPAVTVSEDEGEALRQGRRIILTAEHPVGAVRVYDAVGEFVGLGEIAGSGELKPARIFPA
jgi:tRNA pseudouridine55 synthase